MLGGSLRIKDLCRIGKKAYFIYHNQKAREGVEYSFLDFHSWYLKNFKRKKWKRAHVGRINHDAPYSFSNIEMVEQRENNQERNSRCGNPGRSHKAVIAVELSGKTRMFKSKVEAAKFYGIDVKTVYNKCVGASPAFAKDGPRTNARGVTFKWNT